MLDGANATLGITTGAAVITDATGTLQQYLRGLVKQWIAGTLVLGTGANSIGRVAATEKWLAGTLATLTWASSGFSTEVNSVVNGNAILAASALDNSSTLDEFFDISISLGSVTPGAGAPYIGFYLVSLNQDGTTYGDGRFGSAAAGPPASQYFIGSVPCVASTAGIITGIIRGILLPPGSFKLILYNQTGVTLAGSSNTIKIRSYNRSVS